ncbi:Jag N-terminal domain-containing protein [Nitrosophilus kaiyonis]|uniref:Jag N-terminal domain-containing protein n=1 Tax=Nitrosophilus kaiyonis TaxID=2930200 RepID=UPI0024923002|nr:Jag N-terminal domain-containing protein [Nitrosophilus kaiyonis]
MSKRIEAPTLEEAYKKASKELGCSITDLEIEVIQRPSKGFLGFGKKNAVILASCKEKVVEESVEKIEKETIKTEEKPIEKEVKKEIKQTIEEKKEIKEEVKIPKEEKIEKKIKEEKKSELPKIKEEFEEFYTEKETIEDIAQKIEEEINDLFKEACFDIEKIIVKPFDENTLLIEFKGPDSALLIGKEGYRYKALSYMLFNWINSKYNLQIRLEIAEFLKSQEEMIKNYLKPLIEKIKKEGRGQTKVLDGVLVQIALKELRETFPNKYVAIRTTRNGEKYIIVNEFNKKNE